MKYMLITNNDIIGFEAFHSMQTWPPFLRQGFMAVEIRYDEGLWSDKVETFRVDA